MSTLVDDISDLNALAVGDSRRGYLHFLGHWVVNAQPEARPFRRIAESWQWDREERRAACIDSIAGIRPYQGKRWFWQGCAKGNDKSTGVGRRLTFLLAFSRRPLQLYVCSGKLEQAAVITAAMKAEIALNPWVEEFLDVHDLGASGLKSGSNLTVMPMKAATGQGIFPDMLVADEVTHWEHEEGKKFWSFVTASVTKRPECVFEVMTNAGFKGSWQHAARNEAEADPANWDFFEQPPWSTLATWMDRDKIDAMSRLMLPGEKDRLHGNRWIDPGEENGFLTLEDAERCVDPALREQTHGDPNLRYYAVVDYGSGVGERNRDRTALCVMHSVPGTDKVVIDRLDCWLHPTRPIPIDFVDGNPHAQCVEGWVELIRRNFRLAALVLDKYQMEGLAQKFERRNLRVERFDYQAGKRNMQMAQLLREMVRNRRVTWSPEAGKLQGTDDDTFAKELAQLVVKPMSYGYRFDHQSGRHDDRSVSVAMGMIYAVPETRPFGSAGPKVGPPPPKREVVGPVFRREWARDRGLFGMR